MTIFERLSGVLSAPDKLGNYLSNNFEEVYDSLTFQSYEQLSSAREELRSFISSNWNTLRALDPAVDTNLSFLALLLDLCERIGLTSQFRLLYNFLRAKKYDVGRRLEAASLYILDVKDSADLLERFDEVYTRLKIAYENEEDTSDKVLSTAINYYAKAVADFGEFNKAVVETLKNKFEDAIKNDEYSCLNHPLVLEVLETSLSRHDYAHLHIHTILDEFLGRGREYPGVIEGFLIESDSEYTGLLRNADLSFDSIRDISKYKYDEIPNRDKYFNSLRRGVKIPTEEEELYAYMVAYGPMHNAKLLSAFDYLPNSIFDEKINIIDWGCGQGMATMSLLDYLNENSITADIGTITLIEPSKIALERAALHVTSFNKEARTTTVNKDLNSLVKENISIIKGPILHLFSNILDIEEFSLTKLTALIKTTCKGVNYFVCVSPFVNDTRTTRIDTFMKAFSAYAFNSIKSINNKYLGTWEKTWTRVLRVFKAEL